MKTKLTAVIALSGALVVAPSRAINAEGGARKTLEGTWMVQVTALGDCVSRQPLVSFRALLTFAKGGTMTGTTTNPGFVIGQRGTDHGVWTRDESPDTYRASSIALIAFTTAPNPPANPGFQAGSQTIDQLIELTDPDHFASEAVTRFFDISGQKYREGCATAAAQRFE